MYFFPRQCFDVICESCPVKLLWTSPDLKFRWEDGEKSVQMSPDVALPQFNILGHRQRIVEASLSSGNYSRLLADVQFDRALGYYVIQVGALPLLDTLQTAGDILINLAVLQ